MHAAVRRNALLSDHRSRARPDRRRRRVVRRRPARRRRHAAGDGHGPVPDDRDAARLRRRQDRLRVEHPGRRRHRPPTTTTTIYYAQHGYAVLNYTARGFGNSCGGGPSGDHSGACGRATSASPTRAIEARDTQYLLGLLVDEKITKPGAIGVTGISYGGGQSIELAFLTTTDPPARRQLRPVDAARRARRCTSPPPTRAGRGRTSSTRCCPTAASWTPRSRPPGRASTRSASRSRATSRGLYALGKASGYYCGAAPALDPCTERDANITDFAAINAGEPLERRREGRADRDLQLTTRATVVAGHRRRRRC